jgi:hypothetical protein
MLPYIAFGRNTEEVQVEIDLEVWTSALPCSPVGHLRRLGDVRAMSGFLPITAEKADIPVRLKPLNNCGNDGTSRHSPWRSSRAASYQRLLSSFLDTPADVARDLSLSRRSR